MVHPWYLDPITVFDLETTGVDTRNDRIVTGYVATLWPARLGARVQVDARVFANPEYPIHPKATEAHGITNAMAEERGAWAPDVVEALAIAVARAMGAGFPVVVFNGAFDFTMLHFECLRHGKPTVAELLGCAAGAIAPVIDAHVIDKFVEPYRRGSRTLEATCLRWGVRIDGAHDASFDAMAAGRLVYVLGKRFKHIGDTPLSVLHDQQVTWRRIQAMGLQDYFRNKKGQRDAVVDPCWPVCVTSNHVNL